MYAVICRSRGGFTANEKEGKMHNFNDYVHIHVHVHVHVQVNCLHYKGHGTKVSQSSVLKASLNCSKINVKFDSVL